MGGFKTTMVTSGGPDSPPGSAWVTLLVVTLIYIVHSVDRSVMSILVEPIKSEFSLTDSQMGILTGFGYGLSYAIAAVPVGYLIDRVNRKKLLASLVAVWSVFTLACGLAHSYWQLLLARIAVGASEAGGAPASLSIIGDVFPESRRSRAISIFWLSTAVGTAISFGLGGFVAESYGWRATFFVAGLPGLLMVCLLLVAVAEPRRGAMDRDTVVATAAASLPLLDTCKFAFNCRPVLHTLIAMGLKSMVLSGAMVWAAAYLIRVHGMPIAQAGIVVGVCIALFGGVGSLLGGFAGDWIFSRSGRAGQPLVPVATSLVTALVLLFFATAPGIYMAVLSFALFEVFSRMHTAPAYAFLISNSPAQSRGVIISVLQLLTNLVGYGCGPLLVGIISDSMGTTDSLRYGLSTLALISTLAAVHFYLSSRKLESAG